MRIAVCFWGLCRSTERTIGSIERCIFNPIKNTEAILDVYVHTYKINHPYTNPRAKEFNCELNNDAQKILRPLRSILEDQDEVDKKLNFQKYRTQPNPWPEDGFNQWITHNNHIRALWSLKQVTSLWKQSSVSQDYILQCRPDVLQRTQFNLDYLTNLPPKSILIPNFGLIDGVNDRFTAGRPQEMEVQGNRFDLAQEYSLQNSLHSEKFLAAVLSKTKIQIQQFRFLFVRLRSNGELCADDTDL